MNRSIPFAMPLPPAAVIHTSRGGRWLARVQSLPPAVWLLAQAAALWPHWQWSAARVSDGSDDPLGVAAAAMLLAVAWQAGPRMTAAPRDGWLALALIATVAATASLGHWPPLVGALLAALAMASALRAWLPAATPSLPLFGLAVLAVPLVSSLQFYAGYPLRLVTAQLSTWALQTAGFMAERSGASMVVDGQLVIVDAPCSGVQMVWMAYFTACVVAWWRQLPDATLLRRLPWVGAIVLLGNAVRNTVLVGLEARPFSVPDSLHEAVGLVVLATVCIGVAGVMHKVYNGAEKPRGKLGESLT